MINHHVQRDSEAVGYLTGREVLPTQQQILGHPAPRQRCSLPLASLRDGLRPPLTRGGVPGLELASSWAGRTVPPACHIGRTIPVLSGQPRSLPHNS
jgi:hypothetical protein